MHHILLPSMLGGFDMKRTIAAAVTAVFAVAFLTAPVAAQDDTLRLSYQGFLTDDSGNVVQDGNYEITFRLYEEATGGIPLSVEIQTVEVTNGLFDAQLGSNSTPWFDDIFPPGLTPAKRYLEIQVGEDPPLVPRIELTTVPYSLVSQRMSGDVMTSPAELIVSGPDPAIGITQTVDSGFGATIELEVDDQRFLGLRCDKKKTIFEALQTDEFGDTTGMAALKVDTALGATMELAVDGDNFAQIRCDRKTKIFEALQTDEFGDTTGWISQEIDNGVTSFGYMDMPISNVVNVCGYAALPGYGNNFAQMRLDQLTGDTNAIIAQSVDTFGTSIVLEVDGDNFAGIRCDRKTQKFEALQTDEFGDATGMASLTVDS
jgi:hypothetical protein